MRCGGGRGGAMGGGGEGSVGEITATAGRLPARLPHRRPSPLWSGRRRPTTSRPSWKKSSGKCGKGGHDPALRLPRQPVPNIQREAAPAVETPRAEQASRLSQWPVQIKLVPVNAPYFDGARLLIAADCTALRLRRLPRAVHQGTHHAGGLPQAGQRGLFRKADGDHPGERHQKRHRRPHGGALLRRAGDGGEKGTPAEREIHSVAGGHRDGGRPVGGRITKSLEKKKGRSTMKYVCSVCGWEYDESAGYPRAASPRYALERGAGGF